VTKPSNKALEDDNLPEKFLPEDEPFDTVSTNTDGENSSHSKTDHLLPKETPAKDLEDSRKFALGSSMLGWCLFLMLVCILLSLWKPENELIKNGFEAFKLIVMTILGYIFGSNNSKSN
jgi:hypothetical protein